MSAQSSNSKKSLQLLFQRPLEPVFTPRNNGQSALDLPDEFLTDRYKTVATDLATRFGGTDVAEKLPVGRIASPDISDISRIIKIDGGFSLFNPRHRDAAGELIKLFMDQPNLEAFVSNCAFVKDRLNPYLFQYAMAVATAHRGDTRDVQTPSIVQVFPDQFVDPGIFRKLREEATLVAPGNRQVIDIPFNFTASDREVEQRLAYFREDIGVNMHHWHWHLVYPGAGTPEIVNKDRRGELFYYMHSQIIARYNVERTCNSLPRVRPFTNFRDTISEGYFPKIIRSSNNRSYPPRVTNSILDDLSREDATIAVGDLERWRDRIFEAIDQGFVTSSDGEQIQLTEETGIDILGDLVESSQRSANPAFYGSLHNQGHNVISFVHDPDGRHLEDYGVMGDVTTAMRDPIFYRWHSFIDSIFVRYKLRLPQYTNQQLNYNEITIQSLNIQLLRGQNAPANKGSQALKKSPFTLVTFWQKSQVDLSAGLDFGPEGNVLAQFTHLQHAAFQYRIMVNNTSGAIRRGTCRIFIAPRMDENGKKITFKEQRILMLEMDKFRVNLNPGQNTIVRRSEESSVTIPFERTFRAVGVTTQPTNADALAQFRFCGCGWPQHMLTPKGSAEGMQFDLFVMVSNFADDTVNQEFNENESCNDSASFCGIRDQLYPDRRPMGYPFDRNHSATTFGDFIAGHSNMAVQQLSVKFTNALVNRT